MNERKKLLDVSGLKVDFQGKYETVKAVDGISFHINEGETFGLVGESGCGKSQTIRAVLGLLKSPGKVVGGEIRYRGQNLVGLSQNKLRKIRGKEISVIFQEPMTSLNPVLRIKKQIFETFDGSEMTSQEKYKKAVELMNLVGIPDPERRIEEFPHQFSGGMRQRAMIAIALGAKPKLLLADEPTTALDVTIQDQIMKLINELKDELGMSIMLVTHDMGVIAQMCDRVAVMYAGHIVEMADTVTLFAKPRHPYTYALMRSLPDQSRSGTALEPIMGSPPNLANLPEGCPFAPRCKYATDVCLKLLPEVTEIEPRHFTSCHRLDVAASFPGIIPLPDDMKGAEKQ